MRSSYVRIYLVIWLYNINSDVLHIIKYIFAKFKLVCHTINFYLEGNILLKILFLFLIICESAYGLYTRLKYTGAYKRIWNLLKLTLQDIVSLPSYVLGALLDPQNG